MTSAAWSEDRDGRAAGAAYESLVFTYEALRALRDDALAAAFARVGDVLRDRDAIEADGRRLRYEAVASAARVRVADVALDLALGAFARDVVAQPGGAPGEALYARFFAIPHEDVIELGLDAEVPVVSVVVRALDADEALPEALRAHREPLRAALQQGSVALAARPEALAALGRHRARTEAWLDHAGCTLRATRRALERVASARGVGTAWAGAFFGP